jgi:hypothetical protein
MTVLEVRPQRAGWVVMSDRRATPLSSHATADAAVRAARSVLEREPDAELIVRDRYARTTSHSRPRSRG